jgi:hypothetical protein
LQVAEVRTLSLSSLRALYQREDLLVQLDQFSQRFKERIIEIACVDKDPRVSIEAIEITTSLLK